MPVLWSGDWDPYDRIWLDLDLFSFLPRLRWLEMEGKKGSTVSINKFSLFLFNKLYGWVIHLRFASLESLPVHLGDGGGARMFVDRVWIAQRGSSPAAASLGFSSSAALRLRLHVVSPSTFRAERRPPGELNSAVDCPRQIFFNLPAGVPKRRPYCSKFVAFFDFVAPSGAVPGDNDAGLDWMHRCNNGGQGPDRFSLFSVEVLDANFRPRSVISSVLRGFYASCAVPPLMT